MKTLIPSVLAAILASTSLQRASHPFDSTKIVASIDSFVVVTRVTSGTWRPVGGVVQTIARDSAAIRIAVDYSFPNTSQRVEMAMHPKTLAPLAHWEKLGRAGRGDVNGEMMFSGGRARGAFITSKGIVDMPLDSGVVDNDASTALLTTLPLEVGRTFSFRSFASPGVVELTRVTVGPIDTVTVPAGRIPSYKLTVMSRDTSDVFVSLAEPRRVVLVRLGDGSQEMRLINRR